MVTFNLEVIVTDRECHHLRHIAVNVFMYRTVCTACYGNQVTVSRNLGAGGLGDYRLYLIIH